MPIMKRLKVHSLYNKPQANFPGYFERIDRTKRLGLIPMIIIDGKAQTGKSTLARYIASHYDKNYRLIFRLEQIVDYLRWAKKQWKAGNFEAVKHKWLFMDEPQLEAPRAEFWSARNMVIQAFTSSFGFLKTGLIMALPNVKGLSDIVLTNITMRFSVFAYEGPHGIVRKANVKIPLFNEIKNKFYWTTVEKHTIPIIDDDKNYDESKGENFFEFQTEKWATMLNMREESEESIEEKNKKYFSEISNLLASFGRQEKPSSPDI